MRISASFHHSSRRDNPSSDTARATIKKTSFNPKSRRSSHALADGGTEPLIAQRGIRPGDAGFRHLQVGRLVANPADLSAKDRVLVPQRQDLGVLGHLAPGQHHQAAQQTANKQAEDRNDHSGMIPAGKPDQARSNNRALQDAEFARIGLDQCAPMLARCLLGCPGTPWHASASGIRENGAAIRTAGQNGSSRHLVAFFDSSSRGLFKHRSGLN